MIDSTTTRAVGKDIWENGRLVGTVYTTDCLFEHNKRPADAPPFRTVKEYEEMKKQQQAAQAGEAKS